MVAKTDSRPVLSETPGNWLAPARFALVLGGLLFAAFPQVLLGRHTFVIRDFGFFAYPLAHFQRECFWRGELPFWNPYNNCGVPFLAQWNTMPLYPPSLIYLLFPLSWALSFFCLLHLFWAGLGMYLLAQRWTGNRLAASVAGLVLAFNGFSLNLLMWPSHIATLSWMPWVVLTVSQGWQAGGRKLVLGALAGACQMLAGGPETILFTWLILTAIWIAELAGMARAGEEGVRPAPPSGTGVRVPLAALWRFPLMVLLVTGLAAAQLLPFLDLAVHSQRDQGFADSRWSMPGWGWVNFLVPMAFGQIWNNGVFFQYEQFWTSSYYLGTGTVLLAALVFFSLRKARVRLVMGIAIAGLVLAVGDQTFLYRGLRHAVPQLGLMTYPVKFLTFTVFAAPLIAAFCLVQWMAPAPEQRRVLERRLILLAGLFLVLVGIILLWAWRWPLVTDRFPEILRNGLGRALFLVVSTLVLLGLCRGVRGLATLRPFLPALLLLVFWLDVWTHVPQQNPTVPPWVYAPGLARTKLAMQPQPELGQSRAMLSPVAEKRFREFILSDSQNNLLVKRLGYFANCNLLDDLPKVNGFFSLYPKYNGDIIALLYGNTNLAFPRLADFLAVSQVTSPTELFEWRSRSTWMPLASAGQKPIFLDDDHALQALMAPDFDSRQVVLLPPEARALVTTKGQPQAVVKSQEFRLRRVDLEVEATEPSLVVLAQTYYHLWRGYVDGQPKPLLRANYGFQAIEVPGGVHRVRLAYEDRPFLIGVILSLLTLFGCGVVWVRARRRPAQC